MNYKVKYIKFNSKWMVINLNTGVAHSSWSDRMTAEQVSRKLNALS